MSFSMLFFLAACTAMYRLGIFNERHPGRMRELVWKTAVWTWKSLNK